MNYLIDTNIISEVRKGKRCDPNVASWYEKIEDTNLYLSVLVIGEIRMARTQAIPKQDRRKFLNDTLLFLQAADTGAVVISRNSRDLDLLLQLKPQAGVLLYDKS